MPHEIFRNRITLVQNNFLKSSDRGTIRLIKNVTQEVGALT